MTEGSCCSTDKKEGCCPCGAIKMNICTGERLARVGVGAVLVTLAATHQIGLWGWIGIVPLMTGAIGWCGLYTLLKKDGCCAPKDGEAKQGGGCCGGKTE